MKRLILLLILICSISTASYAQENINVYHDVETDICHVSTEEEEPSLKDVEYPERYDTRDYEWYKDYIKIKNQGKYGMCWALSVTTAAEISYCKETGSVLETSAGHLGYFFFNRTDDELKNTTGDKNEKVDEEKQWYNIGGNNTYTFQALANRTGLELETLAPFSSIESGYSIGLENSRYISLEKAEYIKLNESSNYISDLKELVYKYGAAAIGYNATASTVNSTYHSYYNSTETAGNHAVAIIGWDDNFPKENFTDTPSRDGAWIVQNSWGLSSTHENGCIYISYDDVSIQNSSAVGLDMEEYDENEKCYQYDGTAVNYTKSLSTTNKGANVYEALDAGYLEKVGFTQWNEGLVTYNIEVYLNPEEGDPSSGEKKATLTVTTDHAGYNTFDLGNRIKIKKGETFAVVISTKTSAKLGVEKSASYSWINFTVSLKKGTSYLYSSKTWSDTYSNEYCFRIKAYLNEEKTSIENLDASLSNTSYTYTGKECKPEVTIDGLTQGEDYTVTYSDNINVGTGKVTIEGTGFYNGTKSLTFKISKAVPTYEISGTLNGSCNDKLSVIELPEGFSWQSSTNETLSEGTYEKYVKYTPDDTTNYSIVENIKVSVVISHVIKTVKASEAGCSEEGNSTYYTCTKCGKYFSDKAGTKEIEEGSWIIEKLGHNMTYTKAKEAGCDEEGNSAYYTCSRCGKYYSDKAGTKEIEEGSWVIGKLGHSMTYTKAEEATCTDDGNSAYYTCSRCGKYYSDKAGTKEIEEGSWIIEKGHSMIYTKAEGATCTEEGNSAYYTCSKCGKYYSDKAGTKEIEEGSWIIEKLGHNMTYTKANEAGCSEEGNSAYYTCSRCGKYYSDEKGTKEIKEGSWVIEKLGHNMTYTKANEAGCSEEGNSAYYTCERCGKYYSDKAGTKEIKEGSWVIEKLGHNMTYTKANEAGCEEEGNSAYYTCSRCGKYYSDKAGTKEIEEGSWVIEKLGHSMTYTKAEEATCTEEGNSAYYTCSRCGKYYSDEAGTKEIEKGSWVIEKGHSMIYTKAEEATCTEEGNSAYYTCSKCGNYYSDKAGTKEIKKNSWVIEKLGHSMTYTKAKEATCTEDGNIAYYKCERCEKYYSDKAGTKEIEEKDLVVEKTGHSMTYLKTRETSCEAPGIKTACYYCSKCDKYFSDSSGNKELDKESVEIPEDHNLEPVEANAATCTEEGNICYYECKTCHRKFADENAKTSYDDKDIVLACHSSTLTHLQYDSTYTKEGYESCWKCDCCGKCFADETAKKTVDEEDVKISCKVLNTTVSKSCNLSTYRKVIFTWNKVNDATGYKVYYKKSGDTSWKCVTVKGKNSYTTKNLTSGKKYQFKVKAYITEDDRIAYGKMSSTKSVYTLKKLSKPSVKKSLGKAKVSWKKISGADGYQISKSEKKSGTKIVATVKSLKSKKLKATKGKTYYYKVRAYKTVNGKKIYSPWSVAVKYKVK